MKPEDFGCTPSCTNSRCKIWLVQTGDAAVKIASALSDAQVTQIAVVVEGDLGHPASVQAIMLATKAWNDNCVFIFDIIRASAAAKDNLLTSIQGILNSGKAIVTYDSGMQQGLLQQVNLKLRDPVVDLQVVLLEWARMSKLVKMTQTSRALKKKIANGLAKAKNGIAPTLTANESVRHFAFADEDSLQTLTRNGLLISCGCQTNSYQSYSLRVSEVLSAGKSIWTFSSQSCNILKYLAYKVDQMVNAYSRMQTSIEWLQEFHVRAVSYLRMESNAQDGWYMGGLKPEKVSLLGPFDEIGHLNWRFPDAVYDPQDLEPSGGDAGQAPAEPDDELVAFQGSTKAEVQQLMDLLPKDIYKAIMDIPGAFDSINEISLDLGRPAQLFIFGSSERTQITLVRDASGKVENVVTREDLQAISAPLRFSSDNRAGLEGCLHRVSRILNREGDTVGMTIRVGRACPPGMGLAQLLQDLIKNGDNSILIAGRPGTGKTHTLRDLCSRMADLKHRVVIVDTSNEVGGDGDVAHTTLRNCRRMQVRRREAQHEVLVEAVQNHTPDIVAIDEIGTKAEVLAALAVATRVKSMVATVHGSLSSILSNTTLRDLIGGLTQVILSDAEMKRCRLKTKTRLERKGLPTFKVVVELVSRNEVRIHRDIKQTVDSLLSHNQSVTLCQRRWLSLKAYSAAGKDTSSQTQEKAPKADITQENGKETADQPKNAGARTKKRNSMRFFLQLAPINRNEVMEDVALTAGLQDTPAL